MKRSAIILIAFLFLAIQVATAQERYKFGVVADKDFWTAETADNFALDCRISGVQFVAYPSNDFSEELNASLKKRHIAYISKDKLPDKEVSEVPIIVGEEPWFLEWTFFSDWQETVALLCEIVAKNGCLLYDVAIDEDGHFAEFEKDVMTKTGTWLYQNGVALFDTTPAQRYEYSLQRERDSSTYAKVWFMENEEKSLMYAMFIPISFDADSDSLIWLGNVPRGKMIFLGTGGYVGYRVGKVVKANISKVEVTLPPNIPIAPMVFEYHKK